MAQHWRTAVVWGVVLVMAAMQGIAVLADAPTPTPAAETPAVAETPSDDGALAAALQSTSTPAATPTVTPTIPVATTIVTPTVAVATPTPTPAADERYLAVLVNESVVPVGGQAKSEVFVSLVEPEATIARFELHLLFDPEIVGVAGQEIPQIATMPSLEIAEVDNTAGRIVLVLPRVDETLIHKASAWDKVATITWIGRSVGRSALVIGPDTRFTTTDGQTLKPDAIFDGVVFARTPGTIQGRATLQGRERFDGISVSGSLSSTRSDRQVTDDEGWFAITTSHGEGFYVVVVAMPGYLSAESAKPVKITVDSVVDVGEVTLYGGDVNGDNRIDIRDLSYVAWHFDEYDAKADINGDGQVDILDLTLTAGNFGKTGPTVWHVTGQEGE